MLALDVLELRTMGTVMACSPVVALKEQPPPGSLGLRRSKLGVACAVLHGQWDLKEVKEEVEVEAFKVVGDRGVMMVLVVLVVLVMLVVLEPCGL